MSSGTSTSWHKWMANLPPVNGCFISVLRITPSQQHSYWQMSAASQRMALSTTGISGHRTIHTIRPGHNQHWLSTCMQTTVTGNHLNNPCSLLAKYTGPCNSSRRIFRQERFITHITNVVFTQWCYNTFQSGSTEVVRWSLSRRWIGHGPEAPVLLPP